MTESERKARALRLIRKTLDAALADGGREMYRNPMDYFDNGVAVPLVLRMLTILRAGGWVVSSSQAGTRSGYRSRERMGLEDLLQMALVSVRASTVADMASNDQARDAVARGICETLHRSRVVLARRRAG